MTVEGRIICIDRKVSTAFWRLPCEGVKAACSPFPTSAVVFGTEEPVKVVGSVSGLLVPLPSYPWQHFTQNAGPHKRVYAVGFND